MHQKQIRRLLPPILDRISEFRYEICGSLRRGYQESRNVNILIQAPVEWIHWCFQHQDLEHLKEIRGMLQWKNEIAYSYHGLPIYFLSTTEESWGAAMLFWTGSRSFNRAFKQWVAQQGFTLTPTGLFENGNLICGREESLIFEHIGGKFVKPEDRI